jgi:maltose-binding protein MalE
MIKYLFIIFLFCLSSNLIAQGSTNSSGTGNFNIAATWTNPTDLTNNAVVLNSHTVTIPANTNIYANKITFEGNGKLVFSNTNSKWLPASSLNANPNFEAIVNQNI